MRGLFKGLLILGVVFFIPLVLLFGVFFIRVERRVEYRDQAIVQHSNPVGGIHPVGVSAENAGHPGQVQMVGSLPAEMPESVQINGPGSVTEINSGRQPDWQPGQTVVTLNPTGGTIQDTRYETVKQFKNADGSAVQIHQGPNVVAHSPRSSLRVNWATLGILMMCAFGFFLFLLARLARGAASSGRQGVDPEIDTLALRIHEKEEQLMRRLEAIETLLVGELGRGNETRRG
jgi:preprotein translocase subunit YajC